MRFQPAQIAQAAQGQDCGAAAIAASGLAGGGACSLHLAGFQRRGGQHRGGRDQRRLGLRRQETSAASHHQAIFGQAFAQPADQVAPAQAGKIDRGQRVVPRPALQLFGDQHGDDRALAAQFAHTLATQLRDRQSCDPVQCVFGDLGGLALAGSEQDLLGEQRIALGIRRAQRRRPQVAQQRQTQAALFGLRQQPPAQRAQVQPGHLVQIIEDHEGLRVAVQHDVFQVFDGHARFARQRMQHAPAAGVRQVPDFQRSAGLADSAHARKHHPVAARQRVKAVENRLRCALCAGFRRYERQVAGQQIAAEPGQAGAVFGMSRDQRQTRPEPLVGQTRAAIEEVAQVAPVEHPDGFDGRLLMCGKLVEKIPDALVQRIARLLVRQYRTDAVGVTARAHPRLVMPRPACLGLFLQFLRDLGPALVDVAEIVLAGVVVILAFDDLRCGQIAESALDAFDECIDRAVAAFGRGDIGECAVSLAEHVADELLEGIGAVVILPGARALPRGGIELQRKRHP